MVPVDGLTLVGNHGMEEWVRGESRVHEDAAPYVAAIAEAEECLGSDLWRPEFVIENKGPSLAIHYRLSKNPDRDHEAILAALRECPAIRGLVVREGRRVIEILPPVLMDKGKAVRNLVQASGIVGAVFIGDDLTDLDGCAALAVLRQTLRYRALLVGVASDEGPAELLEAVDCVLAGVDDVIAFLELARDWLSARR
jgi:trehalose 6-phosphate phosphatase